MCIRDSYLIDRSAFTTEVEKHKASPTASETVYSPAADVYLIENAGTYALPATVTKGIVIATGDVRVSGQFEGCLLYTSGKPKTGTIEAMNMEVASAELKSGGNTIVSIARANAFNKDLEIHIGKAVSVREMSVFCRQFESVLTVSYTHLDVYKRQPLVRHQRSSVLLMCFHRISRIRSVPSWHRFWKLLFRSNFCRRSTENPVWRHLKSCSVPRRSKT